MKPDLSVAPELALLARSSAAAPPFCIAGGGRPVTVGALAGLLRAVAADPARWWPLARFDPGRPVFARLDGAPGCELWLATTPPGHRGAGHDHGTGCEALTVVAGELAERIVTVSGAADRVLRPNRIRVRGCGDLRETVNPGSCYAVTLCAFAPAAAGRTGARAPGCSRPPNGEYT